MEIVFFGSAQFGIPSLEALQRAGHTISCIITQPDKKKGRGLSLSQTPVKTWATNARIPVYQPEKINSEESLQKLSSLRADFFIVIAYGQILRQEILDIPNYGCLNVHASLLPKYRGAAPINWAIVNGETETGVSVITMVRGMDAGPVLAQRRIPIKDSDTCVSLETALALQGAQCLIDCMNGIANKTSTALPQQDTLVTFAKKLKKEDGLIHWERSSREIFNLIRGFLDWPGAFTYFNGSLLKILSAQEHADKIGCEPGEIVETSKAGIRVVCGSGSLLIQELHMEGKRKMSAAEFIAGHTIKPGLRFQSKK